MLERLQKLISQAGLASRRAAEELIEKGLVTVNGKKAQLGDKADAAVDTIMVAGKVLPAAGEKIYIMLNKPKGYVTTLSDEQGRRCVIELVSGVGQRVYPVGRLDMYSEGLLLLTNDGEFANRMMHPSHRVDKTYRTWVRGEDIGYAVEQMRQPMEIDGYVTEPAEVDIISTEPGGAVLSVTIHEGRTHQVRLLCEAANLKVMRLIRISEGSLRLGDLRPGTWRKLTAEELAALS